MADKIQFRRDTSANWAAANPVLGTGEPGFDTTLKMFKVGDGSTAWSSLPWAVNGAVINDSSSSTTEVWSASKINTAINAAISSTQTVAPTLSVGSVTGNEGTTSEVTITNYNAGFTYTVVSSNPAAFTVSRTGAVITVTHAAVNANANGNLVVSVQDPAKTNPGVAQIAVTTANVDVADTQIQVVDFSTVDYVNNNFSYLSGSLKATADGALYVSDPIAQGGGEANWKQFTPKIYLKAKKYEVDFVLSGTAYVRDLPDNVTECTRQIFIDTGGNEKVASISGVIPAPAQDGSLAFGSDPGSVTSYSPNAVYVGGDISFDGTKLICGYTSACYVSQGTLATPFTMPATLSLSAVNLTSKLPSSFSVGCVEYSSNGKYLFLTSDSFSLSNTSGPGLVRLTLTTPYDASTAIAGSALVFRPTVTNSPNLYNTASIAFSVSFCGLYLLLYRFDGASYTTCYIDCLVTTTPFDFTNATAHSSYVHTTSGNYFGTVAGVVAGFRKIKISPNGKRAIIFVARDAGTDYTYVATADLTTAFDLSTLSAFGNNKTNISITAVQTPIIAPDGDTVFYYSTVTSSWLKAGSLNYFTKPASFNVSGITGIVGELEEMYALPATVPSLYIDTDTVAGNLDHTTAPQIAASSTPALFTRDGTYATKTITYTVTPCDASCLQFKIVADKETPIEKITIDLTKEA